MIPSFDFLGAITGTAGVHVSHMLYADDLTLLTNEPRDMQIMLSQLAVYVRNKHLIVNNSKSEVVHFNSAGENVPVLCWHSECCYLRVKCLRAGRSPS